VVGEDLLAAVDPEVSLREARVVQCSLGEGRFAAVLEDQDQEPVRFEDRRLGVRLLSGHPPAAWLRAWF
jgi:hypothetical protein